MCMCACVLSCFNHLMCWRSTRENHILHRWGKWSIYSAWKTDGHIVAVLCVELLRPWWMKLASQSPVAKPGWFEVTRFAAVDCSYAICSETIVEHRQPVSILYVKFQRHWLAQWSLRPSDIVSVLHLELGTLRTILPIMAKDGQTQDLQFL